MRKIRVGVLCGGRSAEHEVSLQSARSIVEAIDRDRYEIALVGIDRDGRWHRFDEASYLRNGDDPTRIALPPAGDDVAVLRGSGSPVIVDVRARGADAPVDVVFPALHGPYGEDGTIQGYLELAGVPYVGAGVLGSSVGMDKDVANRLLKAAGLPKADFLALRSLQEAPGWDGVVEGLGSPVFIKPANLGSSVGISKASTAEDYARGLEEAFCYDTKVVVEEYIRGREIECAVLGNRDPEASVPGEVIPSAAHGFYSYDAKYIDENGAALVIPAQLDGTITADVQRLARDTFRTLCCEGMARVDFFLRDDGSLVVNEINTIPGFTRISMYPKLWEASGLAYPRLIERLIDLALERHSDRKRLRTSVRRSST